MAKTLWSFGRSECNRVKMEFIKVIANSADNYQTAPEEQSDNDLHCVFLCWCLNN